MTAALRECTNELVHAEAAFARLPSEAMLYEHERETIRGLRQMASDLWNQTASIVGGSEPATTADRVAVIGAVYRVLCVRSELASFLTCILTRWEETGAQRSRYAIGEG